MGRALVQLGDAAPALELSVDPTAGYRLEVDWVAGTKWPNRAAPHEVRQQVLAILDVISHRRVQHGTVLLVAKGPMWVPGSTTRRTTSVVVEAKYSAYLVDATRWADVSAQDVLGLCDDKAKMIAQGYR